MIAALAIVLIGCVGIAAVIATLVGYLISRQYNQPTEHNYRTDSSSYERYLTLELASSAGVGICAWLLFPKIADHLTVEPVVSETTRYGIQTSTAPFLAFAIALLTVTLAELALGHFTRKATNHTQASLIQRSMENLVPRFLRISIYLWLSLTAAIALFGTIVGDADGQSLTAQAVDYEGQLTTQTAGPFAGWRYTLALSLTALAVYATYLLSTHMVIKRPRLQRLNATADLNFRRSLLTLIAAATQFFLALIPIGMLLFDTAAAVRVQYLSTVDGILTGLIAACGIGAAFIIAVVGIYRAHKTHTVTAAARHNTTVAKDN